MMTHTMSLAVDFEDISKCRHFACHCDYTSDSSQHACSENYVQETHVSGTISSEECVHPTEVGSRNGWSFNTIDCDNINSNLISRRYGKSKHVSKTQKVCCIVKTFPLTPVKTTHHTIVVPEVFLSFLPHVIFLHLIILRKERWIF